MMTKFNSKLKQKDNKLPKLKQSMPNSKLKIKDYKNNKDI